eukprot:c8291_g1_i1.p1 GENE.c8291_g1_i1~~c8291_g1_i1.p1  ORF type:complete len:215 (+),score=49.24 c8291_g1_i1:39-683(+)
MRVSCNLVRAVRHSFIRNFTVTPTGTLPELTGKYHNPSQYNTDPFLNISAQPFAPEIAKILTKPISLEMVEIKPDGIIYLPEIKYRRILFQAFGPGGWGLKPLSPPLWEKDFVSREFGLYCLGRFVSQAIGEHQVFDRAMAGAANEAAKSNALMRCCKDLGIASELWDPEFIDKFRTTYCVGVWCENTRTKDKKRLWRRKDRPPFSYPWKETTA